MTTINPMSTVGASLTVLNSYINDDWTYVAGYGHYKTHQLLAALNAIPTEGAVTAEEHERVKADYQHACETIARMHEAATGRSGEAPARGVVEDVAELRERAEAAEAKLDRVRKVANRPGGFFYRDIRAILDAPAPATIALADIRKGDTIRAEVIGTYGTRTSIEGVAYRQILGGEWQTEDHDTLAAPNQAWTYTLIRCHEPTEPAFVLPTEAGREFTAEREGKEFLFETVNFNNGQKLYILNDECAALTPEQVLSDFTGHRIVDEEA